MTTAEEPTRSSAALVKTATVKISRREMIRVACIIIAMRILSLLVVIGVCVLCMGDAVQTLPESRGGQEVVGKKMPALNFDRWLNTDGNKPLDTAGSLTLYRWWTSECPFCKATLPGLEKFREKYGQKGLKVVAVYHPKPPRAVPDSLVLNAARDIGYRG